MPILTKVGETVKKHPYIAAGVVAVAVYVGYTYLAGGGGSSATVYTDPSTGNPIDAATAAAIAQSNAQIASINAQGAVQQQLTALTGQIQTAQQVNQIQGELQLAELQSQIQNNQIAASLALGQGTLALQGTLANISSQTQEALASIQSNATIQTANINASVVKAQIKAIQQQGLFSAISSGGGIGGILSGVASGLGAIFNLF